MRTVSVAVLFLALLGLTGCGDVVFGKKKDQCEDARRAALATENSSYRVAASDMKSQHNAERKRIKTMSCLAPVIDDASSGAQTGDVPAPSGTSDDLPPSGIMKGIEKRQCDPKTGVCK